MPTDILIHALSAVTDARQQLDTPVEPRQDAAQAISSTAVGEQPSSMPSAHERAQALMRVAASVEALNDYLVRTGRELRFSITDASGHMVISVYNAVTDELVTQIPSEEVLALAESLAQGNLNTTGLNTRA